MPRICWQTIFICWKPQRYDKPLKQLGLLSRQADIRRVTGASSVNLRQAVERSPDRYPKGSNAWDLFWPNFSQLSGHHRNASPGRSWPRRQAPGHPAGHGRDPPYIRHPPDRQAGIADRGRAASRAARLALAFSIAAATLSFIKFWWPISRSRPVPRGRPVDHPDHALGLPVLRALSLCTCCRHYPGAAVGRIPRSSHPAVSAFPGRGAGSACTSTFSRLARRIAVGTAITGRPPHRSGLARLRHPAPTSGV